MSVIYKTQIIPETFSSYLLARLSLLRLWDQPLVQVFGTAQQFFTHNQDKLALSTRSENLWKMMYFITKN